MNSLHVSKDKRRSQNKREKATSPRRRGGGILDKGLHCGAIDERRFLPALEGGRKSSGKLQASAVKGKEITKRKRREAEKSETLEEKGASPNPRMLQMGKGEGSRKEVSRRRGYQNGGGEGEK